MNCAYPFCRKPPAFTPVVAIPTVRTKGVIRPSLSPYINVQETLRKAGLNRNRLIEQYETALTQYNNEVNDLSHTDQPTYLILPEICPGHKLTYNLFNWFRRSDWRVMREAAQHYGMALPPHELVEVTFMPLGWLPNQTLELARDRMSKE